jgi:hypothetical protein
MDARVRRPEPVLLWALAGALLLHGGLLLSGSYRRTYDAYVHIFFADHYARGWFTTWEPRWYTGFNTSSYPPAAHQLIAVVSRLTGLELAFVVVQTAVVVLLVLGVYRFSCLWVSPRAASWAAVAAVVSTGLAETVHTFGQLPTTLSLAFLLNALPFADEWIRHGRRRALVAAIACAAATTAAHHVTTLFGSVFFLGPVVVAALLDGLRTPLSGEVAAHPTRLDRATAWPVVARRLRRVAGPLARSALYGGAVLAALFIVVLPYWLWSSSDPITQVPIPHASRADFLADPNAGLVFFVVPWGLTLLLLPYALIRGFTSRAWPLAASVALLALLGTGGTTPVPRLLLGGAYEILTLDRFTFWATIAILPFVGAFVVSATSGRIRHLLEVNLGRWLTVTLTVVTALAVLGSALWALNLAEFRPSQPARIDPAPITAFLDKDDHSRWRYLTLGFGDQMAWLSANTTAQTVDGNYHSARRLPELVSTPVERLEGAKFRGVPGLGSLQQFLTVPGRFHLKFVFSADRFYDPLLRFSGWHRIGTLENGIVVWERADVAPLPAVTAEREIPGWQRLLWGTIPLTAIILALLALLWHAAGRPLPMRAAVAVRFVVDGSWNATLGRLWGWCDRRLAGVAGRIVDGPPTPTRWQSWQPVLERAGRRVVAPARPARRRVQAAAVVAAMVATLVVVTATQATRSDGPESVVIAYHQDLDVRRLAAAHARLDPETRPSFDEWSLQRSVENGLFASYSSLDSVTATLVARDGDRAVVDAHLVSVTSLEELDTTERHELRRVDGRWYLESPAPDPSEPPEQFVARPGIDYLSQGRRRVTTGITTAADVIDRPEVRVLDARLVRVDQRWAVVGRLLNADTVPADVTVTAQLIGDDGEVAASYDAGQGLIHEVRPRETVPFRVDFEGVAGERDPNDPTAGEFRPGLATPLYLDEAEVEGFDVYAQAVVTPFQLDTALTVQELRVVRARDGSRGWRLQGVLRNDSTREATVPHVLVTLHTADGTVAWVVDRYLTTAVRPQRNLGFSIRLPDDRDIRDTGVVPGIFDNGVISPDRPGGPPPPMIALDPATGWSGVTVQAVSFQREGDL